LIIGVISDTHGLLRQGVVDALQDCDHIIHAGDVGDPKILDELKKIAPVSAVRGNIDSDEWAAALPLTEWLTLAGHVIYVLHDLKQLDLNPKAAGASVVISGHTHTPVKELKNGVLYLNPGSVGPRRFNLPISMAKLILIDDVVKAEMIELDS
jgi:uncharacterized protein